jgi:ABC-2 type transport system ATP-binding protein
MNAIIVDNLVKSFSYYKKEVGLRSSFKNLIHREMLVREAVKGISFEIGEGEIVGFLGPNGAGKTTTLKMLSGILFPTGGNAAVLGYVPWERKKEFKKRFSIVMGQKSQLWWDLPANESLYLNKYIYEIDDAEYKKTVDELSGLLDVRGMLNIQVRRLSLGERMKLELIAALIHRPRIMFLDEPTIGLDIISQKKIREFIKYYNQETRTTVILTSHYMNDIEDLCRRTVIINEGRVVYDGELGRVNELFSGKKIIKIQLSEKVEREALGRFGAVKEYDGFNAVIEADRQEIRNISGDILDHLPVVDLNIEDIPVEEGVALLYKKGGDGPEERS